MTAATAPWLFIREKIRGFRRPGWPATAGRGGDIVFRVDDNLSTLADFRYKRKYTAERGENGRGKRCFGKSAQPLVITVPRGTLIRNAETGRIMADMSTDEDVVIAKGGRGGWGNTHFGIAYAPDSALCKARHTR